MAVLRLFAAARTNAGTARDDVPGSTVGEVIRNAEARYGPGFSEILRQSIVWLNGDAASPDDPVGADDEIAILPPVSGGSR